MLCTLCTLSSGGAAASVLALAAALADANAAFAEVMTVPTTCTRLPAQGVMSVPVSAYVPTFESFAVDPDVPADAGTALPAVPVAPAVALAAAAVVPLPAGSVGVADTGGGTGDGVAKSSPGFGASGSTCAFARVNG
jgi:hypothetical protein